MSANIRFWITGAILAATGVLLARVVSGRFTEQPAAQLALYFSGVIIALVGLGVILFGLRKK
jgi:hypothetical protein